MFTLYAMLAEGAPAVSSEWLAAELGSRYGKSKGFSWKYAQLPLAKHKSVSARWGEWLVRFNYEEGKHVAVESTEISKILGPAAPPNLAGIDKRIRVVFHDDPARKYTNETIDIMEFLTQIKGAIVFDPQQKNIMEPSKDTDYLPPDVVRSWATDALDRTLQRLAAEAPAQQAYLQKLDIDADEFALEYDDLFRRAEARWRAGELTQIEYDALKALNTLLDAMSGPEKAALWTVDALQSRPEWIEVRRLAGKALVLTRMATFCRNRGQKI
jgi:hypothetical protein